MNRKFYNPNTKFDPNYRNIQSELWVYLSNNQRAIIGGVFKHLKNHAQIEISEALINYIESDYTEIPAVIEWSDVTIGAIFHMILNRAFGVSMEELFPGIITKVSEGSNTLTLKPSSLPFNKKGGKR